MRDRNYSLVVFTLAQQILGEIGERGAGQRGEWQRAGDVDGGKAETGGEQTVEHAFAKPLREFCGDAVAQVTGRRSAKISDSNPAAAH